MKIIIPNADFSAISIGTTTVPYVPIAETLAYTNAIPTTFATWNDTKKRALNTYFKTLKANGLLGGTKITKLVLPKIGRVDGGVNLITPSQNINFPTSGATYTSNGVQFSAGWASGWTISTYNNCSYGGYNTTARPTLEGDVQSCLMGVSTNGHWLGRRAVGGNLAGMLINATLTRPSVANRSFSTGMVQASLQSTKQSVMVDGEFVEITQTYNTDPQFNNLVFSSHTNGSTTALFNASVGMYYLSATALSQTEMSIIDSATTTLMGVI